MKRGFSPTFLCVCILLSGCGNAFRLNDAAQIVPKESQRITRIDLKKINGKLDKKAIQSFSMFKTLREQLGKGKNAAFSKILLDADKSGVDFNQHGYWVKDNDRNHLYFLLSNPSDFAKMLRESDSKQQIRKSNGVQFIGNDSFMLSWKGNAAVMSMQSSLGNMSKSLGKMSKQVPYNKQPEVAAAPIDPVALFNLSPTRSVLTDAAFQKAMMGNHDVASYYKWGQSIQSQLSSIPGIGEMMGKTGYEDLVVTGFTDFSKGRMTSHTDYQLTDSLKKQLSLFFKPRLQTDFSRFMNHPNNIVNVAMSLNTNYLVSKMGDFDNMLPMADSAKSMFKEALKSMHGDMLFSIRMDTAGIHPILVMPTQQKKAIEKTLKQMLVNKQLTMDSVGVYTLVKKPDTLAKSAFPTVPAPSDDGIKKAAIPTESSDNQTITIEKDTLKDTPTDSLNMETDIEMPPPNADMPSPNPLKGKAGFKMNRMLWQNDMLIMTDSSSAEIMRQALDKPIEAIESTTELAKSAFGLHLNLDAALSSGYPAIMLVKMMLPNLPISDLRMTMGDKGADTVITSAEKNENIMMTWLRFANQIGGFFGGMLNAPAEPNEDEKK
jgi:hypothetical protein